MEPLTSEPADRLHSLLSILGASRQILGDAARPLERWEERLRHLVNGEGEIFRVAVAGSVKSGKSTLVDALIGRDLLKRGAGIVTSLVTRIRPGTELRAFLGLKGWSQVNREITESALFLGVGEEGKPLDLRRETDRDRIRGVLSDLGEGALGEGGFFEKNTALLEAYLEGFGRVEGILRDEPRTLRLEDAEFEKHRDFAGEDALAAYVDDLVLEIPDLPAGAGRYELGDCQGYDSPNPRHMEKVQEYLMTAHSVVYVVSSRVGLREADLRFLRDIKAIGLLGSTSLVLNADLGEHSSEGDLTALRDRVASELAAFRTDLKIYTFSALRALYLAMKERAELQKKDELMLSAWQESPAVRVDDYPAFHAFLGSQLGEGRGLGLDAAVDATTRQAAASLRSLLSGAMTLASRRAESLTAGERSFLEAREQAHKSLRSFEVALSGLTEPMKRDLFGRVDAAFHPLYGTIAQEVLDQVRRLELPAAGLDAADLKQIFHHLVRIYQEMRAAFHRYKVEVVNPKAVAEIRALWAQASRSLADAAEPTAELLVKAVEAYRAEAASLGIDLPPLEVQEPDLSIPRRPIPLFSAVTQSAVGSTADRVLSFAGQWTRGVALGWVSRLFRRARRPGLHRSLLADGAEAARKLLAEETYSNLLNYNEEVKYHVLGASLEELAQAWAGAYRTRVEALVLDLDALVNRIRGAGSAQENLVPRLEGILQDLDRLAA